MAILDDGEVAEEGTGSRGLLRPQVRRRHGGWCSPAAPTRSVRPRQGAAHPVGLQRRRYDRRTAGGNDWRSRTGMLCNVICRQHPEAVGRTDLRQHAAGHSQQASMPRAPWSFCADYPDNLQAEEVDGHVQRSVFGRSPLAGAENDSDTSFPMPSGRPSMSRCCPLFCAVADRPAAGRAAGGGGEGRRSAAARAG